jgi:hypothetical protein
MDVVTLIVDAVIAMWVVAVLVGIVRAIRARPPRLAPLPEQTRNRFEQGWDRISARFLYEPQRAVGEADALALSVLSARGHPLNQARLPREMQRARHEAAAAANGRRRDKTEALRQVLLQYRLVIERMIGPKPRQTATVGRREVA